MRLLSLQEFKQLFEEKALYMRRTAAAEVRSSVVLWHGWFDTARGARALYFAPKNADVTLSCLPRISTSTCLPPRPASLPAAPLQLGLSQYETQIEGLKAELADAQKVGCGLCGMRAGQPLPPGWLQQPSAAAGPAWKASAYSACMR